MEDRINGSEIIEHQQLMDLLCKDKDGNIRRPLLTVKTDRNTGLIISFNIDFQPNPTK